MPALSPRAREALVVLSLLLLLPLLLLGDSVFGGRTYVPYDLAEFPPVSTAMTPQELAAVRDGATYDATEPPVWFVPELELVRRSLAAGEYPHWNPYVRGGAPLAAHGLLGLLQPLHWPALCFADPHDSLLALTATMFALAGVLMYGLLRELGLSATAAVFGAVAFAWSGTLAGNGHWYMRMEPLALLPGMVWALLRLSRARGLQRALPAVAFAVATAMAWSASFPPFAIPCTLFCGLFAAVLAIGAGRRDGARAGAALAGWAALALLLGMLLAGAHVMQQAQFFPVSNRPVAPTLASASRFAFDPMGLLGYVLPEAFSHPADRLMPGGRSPLAFLLFSRTEWGTGALLRPDQNYNFSEYAVFPGTLPLLFAAVGCLAPGPRWRLLAAGALLLTWLMAIGVGPFRFPYLLPGIQTVPPYRFAGPACVFVAVLAGLGVGRVCRGEARWTARALALAALIAGIVCFAESGALASDGAATEARWLHEITEHYRPLAAQFDPNLTPAAVTEDLVRNVLFTNRDEEGLTVDLLQRARLRLHGDLRRGGFALCLGAAFLLFASLRGRWPAWWLAAAAALATSAELWWQARPLNRGLPLAHAVDSPVHEFLRQQRDHAALRGGFLVARANPGGGDPLHLPPGTLARERIRDLHFYTYVDRYSTEPMRALYGDGFLMRDYMPQALPDDARLQLPWWDAMGLRFLFSTQPMRYAGVQVGPEVRGPGGAFFVYERPTALPRAWVVPALRPVADDTAMVAAAIAPDFAPREYALVTAADAAALPSLAAAEAARARTVTFEAEDSKRLNLRVGLGPAGWLVLADTWLPGWTVTIDGQAAPMLRANVCQRAVALPGRECTVAFRYRTPGLVPGLLVSAAALLACSVLAALALRARSRNNSARQA